MASSNPADQVVYPQAVDFFPEVADGNGPENVIHGSHVNLLQNALKAIQKHCQYSVIGRQNGGPLIYVMQRTLTLTKDSESRRYAVSFEVPLDDANRYFDGKPFYRTRGLIVSATGYRMLNGQRDYLHVQAAGDARDENARQCFVRCWRMGGEWRRGHTIDCQVMILEP